jgi:hypothetical protein
VQWTLGAGLARALLPKRATRISEIMLAGFPLSLMLLALLAATALAIPYGGVLALVLAVLCIVPLVRWPLDRAAVRDTLASLPVLLAVSIGFGSWMALMWHGPTATLSGFPLGDETFYGSSMWALASHPTGRPNLGNEGENLTYFNMLLPAVGAALLPVFPIDGLLLMGSAAAIAVLGAGLALQAYLSDRPDVGRHSLATLILFLAVVGAAWFPSWLVSSPPVAFAVPLTISVWFWSTRGRGSENVAIASAGAAFIGSALTKVVTAGTLVPLALGGVLQQAIRLSPKLCWGLGSVALAAGLYALFLFHEYALMFWHASYWGPDSFVMFVRGHERLGAVWPFLARDIGAVLIAVAAFRLAAWPAALAIALGIALFLIDPFLLRANFICAAVALALAAVDSPEKLARNRHLVLAAYILIVPAAVFRELTGLASGLFWAAAIGGAVYAIVTPAPDARGFKRLRLRLAATATAATCVILLSAACGTMPVPRGDGELTADARDIWRAVRERTPRDALVFTDQVGQAPGLLEGWNSYAMHGQRQTFVTNWYQSPELRMDSARRAQRFALNAEVLSGQREPTSVPTKRAYRQFAAVISAARRLPRTWRCVHANRTYALFVWDPTSAGGNACATSPVDTGTGIPLSSSPDPAKGHGAVTN